MRVELTNILTEIEGAKARTAKKGRTIDCVYLDTDEIAEFRTEYRLQYPQDEDEMFKGETFWKGVRVKPG